MPTPLGQHREPDLSFVLDRTPRRSRKRLRPGQLVVLESHDLSRDHRRRGLPPCSRRAASSRPGDFLLAFSPEREDPGNAGASPPASIPKVVGGVDVASTDASVALYTAAVDKVVRVSSARVAESSKLLENIFRSVNIALVNELKVTLDRMGIDVWEVIEAAKTKPFGFMPFYPGPGLGGHCIPLDPFYLSWKAAEHGQWTRFVELAGEINTQHAALRVRSDRHGAERRRQEPSAGRRSWCWDSPTRTTSTTTASPPPTRSSSTSRMPAPRSTSATRYFPAARKGRKHDLTLASIPCSAAEFAKYDAVVVSTAHDAFRDPSLFAQVKLVVDTRNLIAPLFPDSAPPCRLVKA